MADQTLTSVNNYIGGSIVSKTYNPDSKVAYIELSGNFGTVDKAIGDYIAQYIDNNGYLAAESGQISTATYNLIFRFILSSASDRVDLRQATNFTVVDDINAPSGKIVRIARYKTGTLTVINLHTTNSGNQGWLSAPIAHYTDTNGVEKTFTFSDFYTNTSGWHVYANAEIGNVDTTKTITLTGVFGDMSQTITVNKSETHATFTGVPQTVYAQSVLDLTATAANGYEFTTAPTLNYTDSNNVAQSVNFTVAANKLTATLNIDLSTLDIANDTINLTAAATEKVYQQITVTTTETNCSVSGLPSNVYENTVLNLTATAANDYEFTTAPTFNYTDSNNVAQSVNFTVAANGKTATLNLNLTTLNFGTTTATITATAAAVVYPTITVNVSETNAAVSGVPSPTYINSVLNLTATANTGYEFETAPQLNYVDQNGTYQVFNFTVAQNKLTATLTLDLSTLDLTNVSSLNVSATAAAVVPQIEKYGTINVYNVTTNNLKDFALQRFFKMENGAQTYFENIDLGNFVHSVKRFYCSIGTTTPEVLKCGNYNTQIAVQTPLNDTVSLNCGSVAIPHKSNDITDFDSDIKIFIPFFGFYSLPVDYVGKTITLTYTVNLVTANAVAFLSLDGNIFDCLECNISSDVVYKTNTENFNNTPDFNMNVLKGLTPYVLLKYYVSENKKIYNNSCLRGVLSSYVGYLQITELTNFADNNITETEKTMLLNELENGVIILATE